MGSLAGQMQLRLSQNENLAEQDVDVDVDVDAAQHQFDRPILIDCTQEVLIDACCAHVATKIVWIDFLATRSLKDAADNEEIVFFFLHHFHVSFCFYEICFTLCREIFVERTHFFEVQLQSPANVAPFHVHLSRSHYHYIVVVVNCKPL